VKVALAEDPGIEFFPMDGSIAVFYRMMTKGMQI
jgi:hypothetical protein